MSTVVEPIKTGVNPSIADLSGGVKTEPTLTPEQIAEKAAADAAAAAAKTPETGDTQQTPEEKAAAEAARIAAGGKPENESTEDDEVEVTSETYYAEVNKLAGVEREWKFPDGVDPLTPAGTLHVFNMGKSQGADEFEEFLAKTNPRGYAFLLHSENGRPEEEFFQKKTTTLPEWDVLKDSVDLQAKFYRNILINRGLDDEQADMLVKSAQDKKKLALTVETEYKAIEKEQHKTIEDLRKESEQREKIQAQDINTMGTKLRSYILENKDLNIIIPEAKRTEFLNYSSAMMAYDNRTRKFIIEKEVGDDLPRVLEGLYFIFSGGDLSQLITNKAKQVQADKMRLVMRQEKNKTGKTGPATTTATDKKGVNTPISQL